MDIVGLIFIATLSSGSVPSAAASMVAAEYCPAPLRHRLQTDSYAGLTDNILFAAFAVTEQSDQVA